MVYAVLGGGLEYALHKRLTEEWPIKRYFGNESEERRRELSSWFASFERPQSPQVFTRAATIVAISPSTRLPAMAGMPSLAAAAGAQAVGSLGVVRYSTVSEWEHAWEPYLQEAVESGAFSTESLRIMNELDARSDWEWTGRPPPTWLVIHYLMRLVLQLKAAEDQDARLFMPARDRKILEELAKHASSSIAPPPFELPDLSTTAKDPEARSVTLLGFDPPDLKSLAAVRSDREIQHYANAVLDLWSVEDPVERERRAVSAMRSVVASGDAHAQISYVFEATGWWLKPLEWAAVPGASIAADVRDVGAAAYERRRRRSDWLLIRPRMVDVSLRDYLRRTENY